MNRSDQGQLRGITEAGGLLGDLLLRVDGRARDYLIVFGLDCHLDRFRMFKSSG